jgi:hypothetical protein
MIMLTFTLVNINCNLVYFGLAGQRSLQYSIPNFCLSSLYNYKINQFFKLHAKIFIQATISFINYCC